MALDQRWIRRARRPEGRRQGRSPGPKPWPHVLLCANCEDCGRKERVAKPPTLPGNATEVPGKRD